MMQKRNSNRMGTVSGGDGHAHSHNEMNAKKLAIILIATNKDAIRSKQNELLSLSLSLTHSRRGDTTVHPVHESHSQATPVCAC